MNVKALFLMLAVAGGHGAASASNADRAAAAFEDEIAAEAPEPFDSADLTATAFEDELAAVTEGNSCNRRVSAALR